MLDYAFLEILESLTRKELKSFRRFIISPYFNRSSKVVRLFDAIARYYPNFESLKLTKENLHERISPGNPYNDITMRRLLFDLQKLCEKYMKQVYYEKNRSNSEIALTEELARRGSEKMYKKSYKIAKQIVDSEPYLNSEVCLNRFQLDSNDFYFGMIKNKINRTNFVRTEAGKLISGITYLISYFMLEAVKHNDTLLNYSRAFNVKHNVKFINQFIDLFDFQRLEIFMKTNNMLGSHIIEVYLNTLKAFLYFDNEEYYETLKESLYRSKGKLSPDDNQFLFYRILNYCIMKTSKDTSGSMKFDNELFDTYKTIVLERYYETESNLYFPVDLYRNILIQSVKVKELKWMEEFIQDYGRKIHPKRQSDIINYSYAMLYFNRNAYDRSLDFLSRISDEEFAYRIDVRNFYLMNYYELEQFNTAQSFIKSHRKFIKENSMVSDETRHYQENFLKFLQKLINCHNTGTKTDLALLKQKLSKSEKTSNKQWLAQKAESLSRSIRRAV
jgi:hypothetical protein